MERGLRETPLARALIFICAKRGPERLSALPKLTQRVREGLGHTLESQSRVQAPGNPLDQGDGGMDWYPGCRRALLSQAHTSSSTSAFST